MESGYIINVAVSRKPLHQTKQYIHLFRTDTIPTASHAREAWIELNAAFPAPHYSVTCTHWDCRGKEVHLNQLEV